MKSPTAKLTDEKVLEIDRLIGRGIKMTSLARRYGVSYSAICAIKYRRSWTSVLCVS